MEEDLATARAMGYCYGAKIVRGAYMDQERRLARQHRYEGEKMQHLCVSVCMFYLWALFCRPRAPYQGGD